jgi:hypothetical protein
MFSCSRMTIIVGIGRMNDMRITKRFATCLPAKRTARERPRARSLQREEQACCPT